jgi:hypothetical protein
VAVDQIPDWRQVALLAESVQEWLQSMPELTPALCRLDELAKIDRDNYPYGGEHTSERAVMAAKTFLMLANVRYRESVGAGIVPYFIGPVPDGGVQLKWRTTPAQLWLVFHPLGGYGYLFEDRTQPGAFEESDDIPLQEALSLIGKALLPRVRAAGGV